MTEIHCKYSLIPSRTVLVISRATVWYKFNFDIYAFTAKIADVQFFLKKGVFKMYLDSIILKKCFQYDEIIKNTNIIYK